MQTIPYANDSVKCDAAGNRKHQIQSRAADLEHRPFKVLASTVASNDISV